MASLKPPTVNEYHVFLAAPEDMYSECQEVKKFFEKYNRTTARHWGVRFVVLDAENSVTTGVGTLQQLLIHQGLETYRDSLALVIGIVGQRFGSQTGTETEFDWALESHQACGFPEIKWFFRKENGFKSPSTDRARILEDLERWDSVVAFRERLAKGSQPIYTKEFTDTDNFSDVLDADLDLWLAEPERPWAAARENNAEPVISKLEPPRNYYENLVRDFQSLDIAGIDNDEKIG